MVDPVDEDRLKRLQERIDRARKSAEPQPKSRIESQFGQMNMVWRMVTELVAGIGLGFGIGYVLDAWLHSRPLFLVLFTLLGFAAGVNVMLRTAREVQKEAEAARAAEREGD